MEEAAKESPTLALSIFMEELIPILEKHVPAKKPSGKKSKCRMERRRKLLWRRISKIKSKIKTANSIHKLTRLLQNKSDLELQLLEDYTAVSRAEEDQAVFNMKSNPKSFFSFSKSRQRIRAKVVVTPRPGWIISDAREFFNKDIDSEVGPHLADIISSEKDIEAACSELKSSSAAGADGIPASLLKICKKELSKPLYILWRSSLDKGIIPSDLLLVLISPVHKGGSRGLPKNYRSMALTSRIVKVFERVVRVALVSHLETNCLLPDGQHGFRSFRSTLTQLISYWDTVLGEMEEGNGVDVIYTDFGKAFDKVETGVLLHKLKACGIEGKVGSWIAAFLDSEMRQQAVVVDGRVSSLTPVISGVPQGTVLGPILFLIHIRDIANEISSSTTASSFADDTRVQRGVSSLQDCSDLQRDLGTIYRWAKEVNMHFNGEKFECIRFWPNNTAAPEFDYKGPDGDGVFEGPGSLFVL